MDRDAKNPVGERNILLGCGGAQAQPQQILKASPYASSICGVLFKRVKVQHFMDPKLPKSQTRACLCIKAY